MAPLSLEIPSIIMVRPRRSTDRRKIADLVPVDFTRHTQVCSWGITKPGILPLKLIIVQVVVRLERFEDAR